MQQPGNFCDWKLLELIQHGGHIFLHQTKGWLTDWWQGIEGNSAITPPLPPSPYLTVFIQLTWFSQFFRFFLHWFQTQTFRDRWHRFLRARCSFCHSINSVKALRKLRAVTQTKKIIRCHQSSFFHSPQDSWKIGCCAYFNYNSNCQT